MRSPMPPMAIKFKLRKSTPSGLCIIEVYTLKAEKCCVRRMEGLNQYSDSHRGKQWTFPNLKSTFRIIRVVPKISCSGPIRGELQVLAWSLSGRRCRCQGKFLDNASVLGNLYGKQPPVLTALSSRERELPTVLPRERIGRLRRRQCAGEGLRKG